MKTNAGRRQRLLVRLGVACVGLLPLAPLSAQEPKLRATLKGHTGMVYSIAYSPDGKTLATGSDDERLANRKDPLADTGRCSQGQPPALRR
jgi:WD domain, G-beta repeat